jgi:hypothetical protein
MVRTALVAIGFGLLAAGSAAAEEMPNAVPTVMYKRWGAEVTYGYDALRARTDGADVHHLIFFEMAVRFRIITELEVGASIGGALLPSLGYASLRGDVRYRLLAERPWNIALLAGVGFASFGYDSPKRLLVRGGVGVERRFQSWAFAAELHLARISDEPDLAYVYSDAELRRFGTLDGALSIGALYYWGSGGPSLRRHGIP